MLCFDQCVNLCSISFNEDAGLQALYNWTVEYSPAVTDAQTEYDSRNLE
jgi:hypothetical protein